MKEFNFNQKHQDDNLEALLSYRKKKIAKQEVVFTVILITILTMFILYAVKKIRYTEFDGYITTEIIDVKANDDLFVTKVYKEVGNFVQPGDTLFSYIYMQHFMEYINMNNRPDIVDKERDVQLDFQNVRNEINLLKAQIAEVEKQLRTEDHNIKFGISDNDRKLDLERNLVELKETLKGKWSEYYLLGKMSKELNHVSKNIGYDPYDLMTFDDLLSYHDKRKESHTIYRLAHDTALVVDIPNYNNSMIFKKEEIMKLQSFSAENNKLHVRVYLPLDKVKDVDYHSPVEVIINDDWSFKAHLVVMASKVVNLPDNLRSNFSKETKVLQAIFTPYPMQDIPFWAITDGLPVKLRMSNLSKIFSGEPEEVGEHLIFRTEHGLREESKKRMEKVLRYQ